MRGSRLVLQVQLTNPGAVLLEGTTQLIAEGGVFTFKDLSISTATPEGGAAYVLRFDLVDSQGITGISSSGFFVSIGPAVQLIVVSGVSFGTSGLPFLAQPCVSLLDAGDNLILSERSVSAALVVAGLETVKESLTGSTKVLSSGGRASFTDLRLNGAVPGREYRLKFSSDGLEALTSTFLGAAGPAVLAEMVVQPPTSTLGGHPFALAPIVRLTDAGGTPAEDGTTVTLHLSNDASNVAVLRGGVAHTEGGLATFRDVVVVCQAPFACAL